MKSETMLDEVENADLILSADQDSYIVLGDSTLYGGSNYLRVDENEFSFLQFNIARVEYASSCFLEIYNAATEILQIGVYGLGNDSWDEISINGLDYPTTNEDPIEIVTIVGTGWYRWTVTDFINEQDDDLVSFMLKAETTTGLFIGWSDEFVVDNPKLSVNGTIGSSEPQTVTTTQTETSYSETLTEEVTTTVTQTNTETITESDFITLTEITSNITETSIETSIIFETVLTTSTVNMTYYDILTTVINNTNQITSIISEFKSEMTFPVSVPLFLLSISIFYKRKIDRDDH
ncbi:MAG: hypothetical protein INQ03_00785 [Candidatus Heimdallarchaeota archaeon]|nr:hypothetical protein [Candidatus Heimdallarchaeota archaeon]